MVLLMRYTLFTLGSRRLKVKGLERRVCRLGWMEGLEFGV